MRLCPLDPYLHRVEVFRPGGWRATRGLFLP